MRHSTPDLPSGPSSSVQARGDADAPAGVRIGKWRLIALYWLGQTLSVFPIVQLIAGIDSWSDLIWPPEVVLGCLTSAAVLIVLQVVFVWPVRRPVARAESRGSLRLSVALGGLGAALLFVGLIFTSLEFSEFVGSQVDDDAWLWAWWGGLAVGWFTATPLLIFFSRRAERETFLARLAARLFLGTIIETAAVIPLDVMVRRKSSCYCGEGTFFTLLICGGVGLFALGPAILLPLLARRRKRWYEGHCDACGYNMQGNPNAERCPECGAGWKPSPAAPAQPAAGASSR